MSMPMSMPSLVLALLLAGSDAEPPPEALRAMSLGNAALRAGRIDDAIRAYTRGHRLFPSPHFLFNLGQAYREGGHDREALETFRRFIHELERRPPEDEAGAQWLVTARTWAAELETSLAADSEKPPPPAATAAAERVRHVPSALPGAPSAALAPAMTHLFAPAVATGEPARHGRRKLWWAVAAVAVAVAAASVVVVATVNRRGCPSAAVDGCF